MAYNTKNIIRDASGAPIPQFYNPVTDAYQPLTGVDLGGGRYGYDGLVWGKTAGGLYVPVKVADDGTVLTQLTGSNVIESAVVTAKTTTATYTFSSAKARLNVFNKGRIQAKITINSKDIYIQPGEVKEILAEAISSFSYVSIAAPTELEVMGG